MVRPSKTKHQPRAHRLNVYFTEAELAQVKEASDQAGIPASVLLRKLALAQQIRPARSRSSQELITTLNKLGGELNKVGSNLNQLVKEANSGRRPDETSILHVLDDVKAGVEVIVLAIKRV